MGNINEYFKRINENQMLTQSFLIGNTTFNEIKEELTNIICNYILEENTNIENNPNIYILQSEDKNISSDNIRQLLKNIKSTSQFTNKKIYIIDRCEDLNPQCNNILLKTLEEPPKGVYAFLLTNNIDSIIPTISSRCQKIFISSSSKDILNNEYVDIANQVIDNIETNNIKTIYKFTEIYSIIKDRNTLLNVLKIIMNIYEKTLMNVINNKREDNIIAKNNDIDMISKKMIIINNNINRLKNNLNKNISIDRFLIEMWRCNNESS